VRPMDARVREAWPSDGDALIALSRGTISASYRTFLGDDAVTAFVDSGAVERYVEENLARCSVILADGKVVGYAVCKGNRIDLMMIDRDHQRRGLGTELLAHCESMLFRGFDELLLESFEDNQPANGFYRKHGWVEADRYFDSGSGVRKIVFRKPAQR